MKETADLIRAIATLLSSVAWPVAVCIAVYMLREHIGRALGKLRQAGVELMGQKVSLEFLQNVEQLDKQVAQLPENTTTPTVVLPGSDQTTKEEATQQPTPAIEGLGDASKRNLIWQAWNRGLEFEQQVYRIASESPRSALMLLGTELEKSLNHLGRSVGLVPGPQYVPLRKLVHALEEGGFIPYGVGNTIDTFWRLRNQVVHGGIESRDEDILRVIDSGMRVLRFIGLAPISSDAAPPSD